VPRHVDRRSELSTYSSVTVVDVHLDKTEVTGLRRSNSVDSTCDGGRSTDDRRQFITLSVHVCVQHDACDAACLRAYEQVRQTRRLPDQ